MNISRLSAGSPPPPTHTLAERWNSFAYTATDKKHVIELQERLKNDTSCFLLFSAFCQHEHDTQENKTTYG